MAVLKKLKLFWQKKKLKRNYMVLLDIEAEYDCSPSLIYQMSSRFSTRLHACNEAIRKINKLDPGANLDEMSV